MTGGCAAETYTPMPTRSLVGKPGSDRLSSVSEARRNILLQERERGGGGKGKKKEEEGRAERQRGGTNDNRLGRNPQSQRHPNHHQSSPVHSSIGRIQH